MNYQIICCDLDSYCIYIILYYCARLNQIDFKVLGLLIYRY